MDEARLIMLRAAVTRGLALFTDQELVWIDTDTLDVGSFLYCPLGQCRGWNTTTVPQDTRFHYGFVTGGMHEYSQFLTEEWCRQIQARRERATRGTSNDTPTVP